MRVMQREGFGTVTNDPLDTGGRTQWGVSERSNPQAWADGAVTEAEARKIFLKKYVVFPRFNRLPASYENLRDQLIDYGFNSGPNLAIQKLQEILNEKADGIIGPKTLLAIRRHDPITLNNKLVAARIRMIGRIVQKAPSQSRFINGWLDRALSFLA